MTRRSTRTITVFSCTSLTTTPCRMRLGIGFFLFLRGPAGAGALVEDRLDPRDVAPHLADPGRVLELAARALEAQVEGLLAEVLELLAELVAGLRPDVARLHAATFSPRRVTRRVRSAAWPPRDRTPLWPAPPGRRRART